jgi:hypothetical protein
VRGGINQSGYLACLIVYVIVHFLSHLVLTTLAFLSDRKEKKAEIHPMTGINIISNSISISISISISYDRYSHRESKGANRTGRQWWGVYRLPRRTTGSQGKIVPIHWYR